MSQENSRSVLGSSPSLVPAALPETPSSKHEGSSTPSVKNIVLVHGAFADGSSWYKVIPLLQEMGYTVSAAQNPLLSLAEEVASTRRTIALMEGPVILVGHSWGGAVITEAGDIPQVAGLVYIAAYAPEPGESANDASGPYGWTEGQKQIRVDGDNFATISAKGMFEYITEGLPESERAFALSVQGQSYGPLFSEKLAVAAWEGKPTWCLISERDQMLPPAMEEAMAKRMGALLTRALPTCHMVIQQEPAQVAALIDEAAKSALAH
jgi:pimeloyl-ACP methyl ester carboxylesterase